MLVHYSLNWTVYNFFGPKTRSLWPTQLCNDRIGWFSRVDQKLWQPLILKVRIHENYVSLIIHEVFCYKIYYVSVITYTASKLNIRSFLQKRKRHLQFAENQSASSKGGTMPINYCIPSLKGPESCKSFITSSTCMEEVLRDVKENWQRLNQR